MMRLTQREKLMTVTSVIFILTWALFTFALKPAMIRAETLSRVVPQKQNELHKIRIKSKEYIFLQKNLHDLQMQLAAQERNFELLPYLESLIRQGGLEKRVVSMKHQELPLDENYSENIVQMRLEAVTIKEIIDLLQKIKTSNVLTTIKSLYIKKNQMNANLLDSIIEIRNPKINENIIYSN